MMLKRFRAVAVWLTLVAGFVYGLGMPAQAQGPFSAQIQLALRAFLGAAHTWTGVQTFSGGVVSTGAFDVNISALATTSTDGYIARDSTAATGGVPVQISPRSRWCGTAWNSVGSASEVDCWITENLPATVAGATTSTLRWGASIAGGAYAYRMTLTSGGTLTTTSFVGSNATLADSDYLLWNATGAVTTTADGKFVLSNRATTSGIGFDLTTDGTLKIRNRAQTADGALTAAAGTLSVNALAATSTDGLVVQNTTAATNGTPVQISPRSKWCGTAYNSTSTLSETDCFIAEVLPNTIAGTTTENFKIGHSVNGGAVAYDFTIFQATNIVAVANLQLNGGGFIVSASAGKLANVSDGVWQFINTGANGFTRLIMGTNDATTAGLSIGNSAGSFIFKTGDGTAFTSIQFLGAQAAATSTIGWSGRGVLASTADKLLSINNNANDSGVEINASPTTLGTCTGGTIVSGSHSAAGSYTGNTSSSCIVNFAVNWSNAPFCHAMSRASATHPHVTAVSASAVTFTGGVSGEQIDYQCIGRIGT